MKIGNKTRRNSKWQLLAATALGAIFSLAGPTPVAYAGDNCSDPKSFLSYTLTLPPNGAAGPLSANVRNNSSSCTVQVGIASYKTYDSNIENDSLFDSHNPVTLTPGGFVEFTSTVPTCAYEAFVFYGDLLNSFQGGLRYGTRALATGSKGTGDGYNYCTCGCTLKPTPTPTPGVPCCNANVGSTYTADCKPGSVSIDLHASSSLGQGSETYSWKTNCPDGTFSNASTLSPTLLFTAADGNNMPVSCEVDLTVNGSDGQTTSCSAPVGVGICKVDCKNVLNGTATVDRCGVCGGDGTSCIKCDNTDISGIQIKLDSSALAKRNYVYQSTQIMTSTFKGDKKIAGLAKKTNVEAAFLYQQNWTSVYSLPAQILSCEESPFCVQVSTAPTVEVYSTNNTRFIALIDSCLKQLKKGPKSSYAKVQQLKARTKALAVKDEVYLKQIPPSQSSCS